MEVKNYGYVDGQHRHGSAIRATWDWIAREGPISRADLRARVSASPSTITLAVQELLRRGLVRETGDTLPTGGRPARMLDLTPDVGIVLAVHVDGDDVRAAAADLRGTVVTSAVTPTPKTDHPEPLRAALGSQLKRCLESARKEAAGPVLALAASVAGIVDPRTGSISLAEFTIPGWRDGCMNEWLVPFHAPVLIENDANLAAVAEHQHGSAKGAHNALVVIVGPGIGAGLILNNKLYRGANGAAGEVGLFQQLAGNSRGLDYEAGTAGLMRRHVQHGGDPSDGPHAIIAAAAAGQPAAVAAVDEIIDQIAVAIANAVLFFDPDVVVVGGLLATEDYACLQRLRNRVSKLLPTKTTPEIVQGTLGAPASLIGATTWAANHARTTISAELGQQSDVPNGRLSPA